MQKVLGYPPRRRFRRPPCTCSRSGRVIRRVGGLEVSATVSQMAVYVIRRVGGLEDIFQIVGFSDSVIRRVGGLEAK